MKRIAVLAAFAALAVARQAQAARELKVTIEACPELSELELQRLTELELATVAGGESNQGVAAAHVVCSGTEAQIRASEPGTGRSLNRSLVLEAELQDRARVVAIAVAQLVRALDWLPTRPAPAPAPKAPAPAPPQPTDRATPATTRSGMTIEALAGLRRRDPDRSFFSQRLGLASAYRLSPRWALGAGLSFERGATERAPGDVQATLLSAGARLDLQPWPERWLGLLARGELALTHLSLRGREPAAFVEAAEISGLGLSGGLALGPLLRVQQWRLALLAEGGVATFGGSGLVSRDAPVSLNIPWLGAELAVLVDL